MPIGNTFCSEEARWLTEWLATRLRLNPGSLSPRFWILFNKIGRVKMKQGLGLGVRATRYKEDGINPARKGEARTRKQERCEQGRGGVNMKGIG